MSDTLSNIAKYDLTGIKYFDNNATTFMPECVEKVIYNCFLQGNPSSNYDLAQRSTDIIGYAARYILNTCKVSEQTHTVIFNSGASEGNITVLKGFSKNTSNKRYHYVSGATEHKSILLCLEQMAKYDGLSYDLVSPVNGDIMALSVANAIKRKQTRLVSLMSANNETGIITNIGEIFRVVKSIDPSIICHTDAVQYFGKFPIDMSNGVIDVITISFHKMHGPPNSGCIVIKNSILPQLVPLITGTQYNGYRGGTQNISLIAGSIEGLYYTLRDRMTKNKQLIIWRDNLMSALLKNGVRLDYMNTYNDSVGPSIYIFANNDSNILPNTIMFSVLNRTPKQLFVCCNKILQSRLNKEYGIIVSTGSACNKTARSYVLESMVINPPILLTGAIRISFGDNNSSNDVRSLISGLLELIGQFIAGSSVIR